MTEPIKIYVANLGKYNEGELVGQWLTLPATDNEIKEMFANIGVGQFCEEYAIHDYEAPFEISEHESIEELNEFAKELDNLDESQYQACMALIKNGVAMSYIDAINYLDDIIYYPGCDDMADVAYQYYEESGMLKEIEKYVDASYIDWDAIGRDMEIEGKFLKTDNGYIEYNG